MEILPKDDLCTLVLDIYLRHTFSRLVGLFVSTFLLLVLEVCRKGEKLGFSTQASIKKKTGVKKTFHTNLLLSCLIIIAIVEWDCWILLYFRFLKLSCFWLGINMFPI
jgi:hypothetical protein